MLKTQPNSSTASSRNLRPRYGERNASHGSRLEAEGRASEILDAPERFADDLTAWLELPAQAAARAPLRWLHELRRQQYSSAAGTLQALPQVMVLFKCCVSLSCTGPVQVAAQPQMLPLLVVALAGVSRFMRLFRVQS